MWQTAAIGRACRRYRHAHRVVLGFISAYFGGWLDIAIRSVCQVLTPIPVLLLQVVIAGSLDKRDVTILTMAFIVRDPRLDGTAAPIMVRTWARITRVGPIQARIQRR